MLQSALPLCYFFPSQSLCQECSLYPTPISNLIRPFFFNIQFKVIPSLKNPLTTQEEDTTAYSWLYANSFTMLPHTRAFGGHGLCLIHTTHTQACTAFMPQRSQNEQTERTDKETAGLDGCGMRAAFRHLQSMRALHAGKPRLRESEWFAGWKHNKEGLELKSSDMEPNAPCTTNMVLIMKN